MGMDEKTQGKPFVEKPDLRPELWWPKAYPRMGYCPQCNDRVGIGRPPFPVLRFVVFAALTFFPAFFVGITTAWFLIGFAIWRKGKATCNACDGQDIWLKAGRDTEGLWWDAAIILLVIWWAVSWGIWYFAELSAALS